MQNFNITLPSKWFGHDKTAILPLRSDTTAVSTSISMQSATNLWTGSQYSCSSFFASWFKREKNVVDQVQWSLKPINTSWQLLNIHNYIKLERWHLQSAHENIIRLLHANLMLPQKLSLYIPHGRKRKELHPGNHQQQF